MIGNIRICKREEFRWRKIFFLKKETCWIRILRIFGPYLRQRRYFGTCVVRKMTKAVASGTCCLCANIRGDFYTLFDPFVRPPSTPPRWPGSPSGHNIATTTLTTIIKYRPLVCVCCARPSWCIILNVLSELKSTIRNDVNTVFVRLPLTIETK